jgi:EF hand domain-containing protein
MKLKRILIVPVAALLIAAGAKVGTAIAAQDPGTQTASPDTRSKSKKVAEGEIEAKRLLLLMDQDQNGKVSHQEFMSFMEAEFQRLDVNKDGELDVKELVQARFTPHVGTHR